MLKKHQYALTALGVIESRIRTSDVEGLKDRWDFGHELLIVRGTKKRLPNGFLARIVEDCGISAREVQYRMRFASRFSKDDAIAAHLNWAEVIKERLTDSYTGPEDPEGVDPDEVEDPEERPWWSKYHPPESTPFEHVMERFLEMEEEATIILRWIPELSKDERYEAWRRGEEIRTVLIEVTETLNGNRDDEKALEFVLELAEKWKAKRQAIKDKEAGSPADVNFDDLLVG